MSLHFLASPRQGHLNQAFHIFAYLKRSKRFLSMNFADTKSVHDESCFQKCDWSKYYPRTCDAAPLDVHKVQGQLVAMSCTVDADHHVVCCITCCSHTGVWIQSIRTWLRLLPLDWSFLLQRLRMKGYATICTMRSVRKLMGQQILSLGCVELNQTKSISKRSIMQSHIIKYTSQEQVKRMGKEDQETN